MPKVRRRKSTNVFAYDDSAPFAHLKSSAGTQTRKFKITVGSVPVVTDGALAITANGRGITRSTALIPHKETAKATQAQITTAITSALSDLITNVAPSGGAGQAGPLGG